MTAWIQTQDQMIPQMMNELDLATIDNFSELHTEPEHVELIMKLLTEKELASKQ